MLAPPTNRAAIAGVRAPRAIIRSTIVGTAVWA